MKDQKISDNLFISTFSATFLVQGASLLEIGLAPCTNS